MPKENVFFLKTIMSVDDLLSRINALVLEDYSNSVVILDEFDLHVFDIIERHQEIKDTVKRNNIKLIMAPNNRGMPNAPGILKNNNWGDISNQLQKKQITVEQTKEEPNNAQSIGFYFDGKGISHAFPKQWEKQPVHSIPNTNIGVSICGEINSVTKENSHVFDCIYNPSKEGDDPTTGVRMKAFFNPSMTKAEVDDLYCENRYDGVRPIDESDNGLENSAYTSYLSEVNLLWEQIKTKTKSFYLCEDIKTPVIRADGDSSGILNPMYVNAEDYQLEVIEFKVIDFYVHAKEAKQDRYLMGNVEVGERQGLDNFKKYKGDLLKTKILVRLQKKIDKVESIENLNILKKSIKESPEYDILVTYQGFFKNKLNETKSVQALNKIFDEKEASLLVNVNNPLRN